MTRLIAAFLLVVAVRGGAPSSAQDARSSLAGVFVVQSIRGAGQSDGSVYRAGGDVKPPLPLRLVDAEYPLAAREAGVEGDVWIEAIVNIDGVTADRTVVQSADKTHGLDDAALAAVRNWVFKPAQLNNQPVRFRVLCFVEFRARRDRPEDSTRFDALRATAHAAPEPGLINPIVEEQVQPLYLAAAVRARASGKVTIEAIVQPDGSVGAARLVQADDLKGLELLAAKGAERWRFQPALLAGKPVPALARIVLSFNLR